MRRAVLHTGLWALAVLPLWAGAALAASPYNQVADTSHNFAGMATIDEVCASCHLPDPKVAQTEEEELLTIKPLWGGDARLDGTFLIGTDAMFGNTSRACLECHDGVTATAVHGNTDFAVPGERGGTRKPDHPVEIPYTRTPEGRFVAPTPLPQNKQYWPIPNLAAGELELPAGPVSTRLDVTGSEEEIIFGAVRTRDGKVHCESCHNPHSNRTPPYLRAMPPDLCLTCHDK